MAQIHVRTVTSHTELVRAMVPLFVDTVEGISDDMFINNVKDGVEFATNDRRRTAVVTGHNISANCVRITWTMASKNGAQNWDEDITTHSVESLFGVAEAMVRFVCDAEWPGFCTKHSKSKPRVTSFKDDKPYGTVDLAVLISSSMETMTLYREYMDRKWSYVQDLGGYMHTIGHINDRPICISPMIHKVAGLNVMYVEANSALIDWDMIEDWVREVTGKPDIRIQNSPTNFCSDISSMLRECAQERK